MDTNETGKYMKFYKGINKIECVLVAIVTFVLVVVVFLQVVNRTLIKATISWPEEAARYLMIWQVFLASVIAFRQGANCCIDVITNRFHGTGKIILSCFSNLVCLLFAVVVIIGGIQVMQSQILYNQTSTALRLNMAVVYAALPTWGVLFILELVFMTIQLFKPNAFSEAVSGKEGVS